jgi:hypothetical protein
LSPILVRPVREQLEHDRIIRLLQTRWRRRYESAINVGDEKGAFIKIGTAIVYPDLILYEQGGKRIEGVIEVETGESVNHLEALSQWTCLDKAKVPFYLYVPANMVDVARRLSANHHVTVEEVWSYHTVGEEIRFTLIDRAAPDRKVAARKAEPVKAVARKPEPAKAAARKPQARKSPAGAAAIAKPAARKPAQKTASRKAAAKSAPRKPAARAASPANRARSTSAVRRKVTPRAAAAHRPAQKQRAKGK